MILKINMNRFDNNVIITHGRLETDYRRGRAKVVLLVLALVMLFVISLLYVYPYLYPYDMNEGYSIKTNPIVLIISFIIFLIQTRLAKRINTKRVSGLIILCINFIYFFPGLIINTIYYSGLNYYLVFISYWLVFNLVAIWIRYPRRSISLRINQTIYNVGAVIIGIAAIIIALSLTSFSLNITNIFNYEEVYKNRLTNSLLNSSTLINHFITFCSMVLPIWITMTIKKKNYLLALLLIFAVISIYSIASNRVYILMLLIALFDSFQKQNISKWIYLGLFIIGLSIIQTVISKMDYNLFADFIRRITFTPNFVSRFYYEYFSSNNPDFLRQAWDWYLRPLGIFSEYQSVIPRLIGNIYSYGNQSTFNTGLVGAAFSIYGYYGIVISPILYVLSLRLADYLVQGKDIISAKYTLSFVIAITITNANYWAEALVIPSSVLLLYISLFFLPSDSIRMQNENKHKN